MQNNIQWKISPFEGLSLDELYKLLQLRSEVFVVEQNCVYQDIDGKDHKALHLLGIENNQIIAYARLFKPNDYFEKASIGRVIVKPTHRSKALGHQLMIHAIKGIQEHYNQTEITISAQLYLKEFYQSHQFVQTSDPYLEDGIPHIEMKRE
ncbi:GNAT family N-acetyltransferase [Flavobacterium sp. SUN046]|uniref:GNAT family N-acetyltransferase n=1 Tax=Flavobacterium sp. SUN046 TaxID=3002440 RepID=UPI002DB6A105|nr:GNAT family N-acetyltransferase [Flavobacterium sp. SUN046]MEC4048152.1 GNAT family N-acetyltransferase [Flavobacterium sp. SUN046]